MLKESRACRDCGALFEGHGNDRVRCSSCEIFRTRAWVRRAEEDAQREAAHRAGLHTDH